MSGSSSGVQAPSSGSGGINFEAAMAKMEETFAKAIANNAEITKLQTEGNTAKRAASAAPQ